MKINRIAVSFILLVSFFIFGMVNGRSNEAKKVSKPLEYSGYSKAEYASFIKRSEYVTMSDGVKLAVDIFIPADGPERGKFPVVMEYTPYTRAFVDLKNGPFHRLARKKMAKNASRIIDQSRDPMIMEMVKHGYAFIIADMRGTGSSYGWKADFMPRLGFDGAELVDWAAAQTWSDGNVGMFGGSYLGFSQIVTAGRASRNLKCIVPIVVPMEGYDGQVYPGGVYDNGFMSAYSQGLTKLNLNYYSFNIPKMLLTDAQLFMPAAPVVDEDGDGQLVDEIPIDKNGNGTFLDDYDYPADPGDEPKYRDGQPRKHIYYLATAEHQKNLDYHSWAKSMYFVDTIVPKPLNMFSIYDFDPSYHVPALAKSHIPMYNIGGWFDPFVRGTIEWWGTLKNTNPSKLLIAPGYHDLQGPFWKYLGDSTGGLEKLGAAELIRWFDRWLKGIDNGIDKEPPIYIYVMNGGGWRFENEWPLARRKITSLYFDEGHFLTTGKAKKGTDKFKADFTHDSRYGKTRGNRYLSAMGKKPDKLPVRNELDKKCLAYTTEALAQNTEVTGHPIAKFWVSSSAGHGDFFLYLEDIEPSGRAILVTEGVLRAGFANLLDNDMMVRGGTTGVDVKPELPWHGFEKRHYVDGIFAGGDIIELVIDLKPTSWVFRKGHKIRLSIAAADWPTFRLHPKLSYDNDPKNPTNIVPILTFYRDKEHPSHIELPVIPN